MHLKVIMEAQLVLFIDHEILMLRRPNTGRQAPTIRLMRLMILAAALQNMNPTCRFR